MNIFTRLFNYIGFYRPEQMPVMPAKQQPRRTPSAPTASERKRSFERLNNPAHTTRQDTTDTTTPFLMAAVLMSDNPPAPQAPSAPTPAPSPDHSYSSAPSSYSDSGGGFSSDGGGAAFAPEFR